MNRPAAYRIFEEDYEPQDARLPFTITMAGASFGGEAPRAVSMSGHTRRLSAGELELVGPFALFSNRTAPGANTSLQITLELPSGPVHMSAVRLSYTQLDEFETGLGYLIASGGDAASEADLNCVIRARITEIDERDRVELVKYLRALERATRQTVYVVAGNGQWTEQTLSVTVLA